MTMDSHTQINPSQEKVTLHPKLQVALSSFNVNLQEELDRFQQTQKQRQGIIIPQEQSESPSQTVASSLTPSPSQSSSLKETEEETNLDQADSYLASSEELLRTLSQEEEASTPSSLKSTSTKQKSMWSYLLTPLGIAGMFIFILAGTLMSLTLINLGENRLSVSSSSPSEAETLPPEPKLDSPKSSPDDSIPNRPNLAADEFVELDEDNLVEAEPATEVPPSEKPSCGGNFYCVVVENPDSSEYQKTRQLVADAYLREFPQVGQVLQVGAFDTESRAKTLLQRLEEQGITATIYSP